MQVNQENIQRPALFSDFFNEELIWTNEYLTYIITTVKKNVTSTYNNIKNTLKNRKFRIAQDKDNLNIDCKCAKNLTWSDKTIDKAFKKYKKLFPDCVIVEL